MSSSGAWSPLGFPADQLNRGHRSLGGAAVVSLGTLLLVV